MSPPQIYISDLTVNAPNNGNCVEPRPKLLSNISLEVAHGEAVGVTGASGAGKSTLLSSLLGMVDPALITNGTVRFGRETLILAGRSNQDIQQAVRGDKLALIRQNSHEALHPMYTVKRLVSEHVKIRRNLTRKEAKILTYNVLEEAGIPDVSLYAGKYAHQLSGGEAQRVCLAQALSSDPSMLLADEVFSAVDAKTQQDLVIAIKRRIANGMGLLCVSHHLQLLAQFCSRLVVFHKGVLVEHGPTHKVLAAPVHPHTQGLVEADRILTGRND